MSDAISDIQTDIESMGGSIICDQGDVAANYDACLAACASLGVAPCVVDTDNIEDCLQHQCESIDTMIMDINAMLMQHSIILMYHPDDPGTMIMIDADNPEWNEA